MKNVLIIQAFHPDGVAMLTARPDLKVTVLEDMSPPVLAAAVADAEIITVRNQPLTKELLDNAPKLECIAKQGAGVDKIDVPYCTDRGIPVINTPGANAESVAEQTVALILAAAKKLRVNDLAVRSGNFAIRETRNTLCISGKKILICGFGHIGQTLARLLSGFGMDIHVYDPFVPDACIRDMQATRVTDLYEALPGMDIVSLHLPLTDRTKNLIDDKALARMKPDAILVSAARGGVVNERALYEALKAGRIAGAGLDVFAQEPLPPDDPLLSLDTLVTSPHNAALSREGAIRMGQETARNVIDFVEGRIDPARVVNKAALK